MKPLGLDAYEHLRLEHEKLKQEVQLLRRQVQIMMEQLSRHDLVPHYPTAPGLEAGPHRSSREAEALLQHLPDRFTIDDLITTAESLKMGVFKAYYELQALIDEEKILSDGKLFQKRA